MCHAPVLQPSGCATGISEINQSINIYIEALVKLPVSLGVTMSGWKPNLNDTKQHEQLSHVNPGNVPLKLNVH